MCAAEEGRNSLGIGAVRSTPRPSCASFSKWRRWVTLEEPPHPYYVSMDFAEQLKAQLNIVEVIGQYVRLKKQSSGQRYVGLCPFHSENTPSFNVHGTLGFYKCFGCDAKGDVFKFIQERESLTFPETLKLLAERYGIAMPERQRSDDPEGQKRGALLEMQEIAANTFRDNLRAAGGMEARRYLESRAVSKESMDEFRLGLADASGQQLIKKLQKFGPALMDESGLVGKREDGSFYDRFRARLMFPIHNEAGKVIGFGGRALRPDDKPKYMNSPGTPLYNKSTVLYNLHRAKIDARKHDRMILVEGYMDVIAVYAAGIKEVVAASGTAFHSDQVRMVKRQVAQQGNTGQVILNFDSDDAGAESTEKRIASFLAEGMRVRVLEIPGELDPDEYIQQNGADAYRKLLDGATPYFHWLADRTRHKFDMGTVEGRVDAFKHLWPTIQQVADRIERAAIADEMASYLNLDRETIRQQFKKAQRTEPAPSRTVSSAVPPNEKILLACLLASVDARVAIRHYLASSDSLRYLELHAIFAAIVNFDEKTGALALEQVVNQLEPHLQRILTEISFADLPMPEEGAAEQALHCLRALEAKGISTQCEVLRRKVQEMERAGDFAGALAAAEELNALKRHENSGTRSAARA
jgi:DNA primase